MFLERMMLIGALAIAIVAGGRHMVKLAQAHGNAVGNVFNSALSR